MVKRLMDALKRMFAPRPAYAYAYARRRRR